MWYKIDLYKLNIENLPKFLRKSVLIALLKAVTKPLNLVYNQWLQMRKRNYYWLEHNGQICYLEKALNDQFDKHLRRIRIDNGLNNERTYIHTENENKDLYLEKVWIHPISTFMNIEQGFIVYVPRTIVDNHFFELQQTINLYKDGAKNHRIEKIDE